MSRSLRADAERMVADVEFTPAEDRRVAAAVLALLPVLDVGLESNRALAACFRVIHAQGETAIDALEHELRRDRYRQWVW